MDHYSQYKQTHTVKIDSPKPKNKFKAFLKESLKFIGIFLFFFLISITIIMWPTISAKVSYYFIASSIEEAGENLGLPISSQDYSPSLAQIVEKQAAESNIPKETRVVIPRINVDAPIVFMESRNNEDILEAIKEGIAHYVDTAMPGRIGNMFLTGHSSYYWWSGGKYNQVLALLSHLKQNDLIYIYHKGGTYVYRVKDSIVVRPNQTQVLNSTPTPTLSIMTCIPLGTNLKRLVVRADLISTPPVNRDELNTFIDIPQIPMFLPL